MRFGINTFLYTSPFTNKEVKLFKRFKRWGFDTVEIAVEYPSHINPMWVKNAAEKEGIEIGEARGIQVGEARGQLRGQIGLMQKLLRQRVWTTEEFDACDLARLKAISEQLEQQLETRNS